MLKTHNCGELTAENVGQAVDVGRLGQPPA